SFEQIPARQPRRHRRENIASVKRGAGPAEMKLRIVETHGAAIDEYSVRRAAFIGHHGELENAIVRSDKKMVLSLNPDRRARTAHARIDHGGVNCSLGKKSTRRLQR